MRGQQRQQLDAGLTPRLVHQRHGGLKRVVGAHDSSGIDRVGLHAARSQSGGQQVNAHALAQRADRVQGPRRGFTEHAQRVAEQRQLAQARRDGVEHQVAVVAAEPQRVGGRLVLGANGRRALDDGQAFALDGRLRAAEQQVRDPAHRGGHDGDLVSVGLQRADDIGRLPHGLGAADRRATELQNESLSHACVSAS